MQGGKGLLLVTQNENFMHSTNFELWITAIYRLHTIGIHSVAPIFFT